MKKQILVVLAILLVASVGIATAYNSPILYNANWKTKYVSVEAVYRNGENIKYAIRELPQGTETGDGVVIDTFWAKGATHIQPAMEKWAYKNRYNVYWTYNGHGVYSAKFNTTFKEVK